MKLTCPNCEEEIDLNVCETRVDSLTVGNDGNLSGVVVIDVTCPSCADAGESGLVEVPVTISGKIEEMDIG